MKLTGSLACLCSALAFLACSDRGQVTISGELQSGSTVRDNEKFYLASADNSSVLLDSATVENGQFEFVMKREDYVSPQRMVILCRDHTRGGYLRRVGYTNPFMSNTVESAFYFENRDLKITGARNYKSKNNEVVFAIPDMGSQTEVAFHHYKFKVGPGAHLHNLNLVKKYPNSVDLVHQLNSFRDKFENAELEELTREFGNTVKKGWEFNDLVEYINVPVEESEIVGEVKYIFVANE